MILCWRLKIKIDKDSLLKILHRSLATKAELCKIQNVYYYSAQSNLFFTDTKGTGISVSIIEVFVLEK